MCGWKADPDAMRFDLESAPSMDDVPRFNFVRFALSNAQRWINRVHHEHQRQSCGWRRTWTAARRWTARSCTASHHRAWSRAKARRSSREDAISCRSWRPRTPPAVASLCTTRAARSRSRSERPGAAYRAGVASQRVGARTARGRVAFLSSSGIRWQLRVFPYVSNQTRGWRDVRAIHVCFPRQCLVSGLE